MNCSAQKRYREAKALMLGVDYSKSEFISGLGIGIDYCHLFDDKRTGISFGIGGGPAWGKYRDDLSNTYIENYASQEMGGDTYDGHSYNDRTNGGWILNTNLIFLYGLSSTSIIGIGPRLSYFSKQDYSVIVNSSDSQFIYAENIVMPYRERVIVPGAQINLFIAPITLKYALMKIKGEEGLMHMFGLAYVLSSF
jgi:hypothetical protein